MADQAQLPKKILIVDDDPSVAKALIDPLARYDIRVERASDLDSTFYLFNQNRFDVVVVEMEFGPLTGIALIQKWRRHEVMDKRSTGFIVSSGNKRGGVGMALIKELGDIELINKPFNALQLLPYLARGLVARRRMQAQLEMQHKYLDFYEKTGEIDKAVAQIQKNLDKLGPQGLATMCDLYEKAEQYDKALPILDQMLQHDAENISLLNAKGRMLIRSGRFQDAKAYMEKADQLAPKNIERINEMATMYLQLQDPDKSVEKFRELLALNPENPDLKFEMFSQLYENGYDDHAISFGKETAKPMEIVRHYNNKGVIMAKNGDWKTAIIEYQRALRFYPKFKENYRIYFNIGLAYYNQKNRDSLVLARDNIKVAVEMKPDFEKAIKTLDAIDKTLGGAEKKAS